MFTSCFCSSFLPVEVRSFSKTGCVPMELHKGQLFASMVEWNECPFFLSLCHLDIPALTWVPSHKQNSSVLNSIIRHIAFWPKCSFADVRCTNAMISTARLSPGTTVLLPTFAFCLFFLSFTSIGKKACCNSKSSQTLFGFSKPMHKCIFYILKIYLWTP